MDKRLFTGIMFLVLFAIVGSQSVFTVFETHRAIVLQLGKPVGEVLGPGLHFKLPFIQNVLHFDARLLHYDTRQAVAITLDKKAIVLDNYTRWKIIDPLLFYQRLRTIPAAQARLQDVIYSELLAVVGRHDLTAVVSGERQTIMEEVHRRANQRIAGSGVEVVDVRIKRTDLPVENQKAIFARMRAERERQAMQYRSEGVEEATKLRSRADRERAILMADARQRSEVLRGEGDAEAVRIFAEALEQGPEFFEFVRSLQAYKSGLKDNTKVVLPLDKDFLHYLNSARP